MCRIFITPGSSPGGNGEQAAAYCHAAGHCEDAHADVAELDGCTAQDIVLYIQSYGHLGRAELVCRIRAPSVSHTLALVVLDTFV